MMTFDTGTFSNACKPGAKPRQRIEDDEPVVDSITEKVNRAERLKKEKENRRLRQEKAKDDRKKQEMRKRQIEQQRINLREPSPRSDFKSAQPHSQATSCNVSPLQEDNQSQNSFSLCGCIVNLFAFVESLLKNLVKDCPVSIIPKYPA